MLCNNFFERPDVWIWDLSVIRTKRNSYRTESGIQKEPQSGVRIMCGDSQLPKHKNNTTPGSH